VVSDKVNCTAAELRPVIMVSSVSIGLNGRVVVSLCFIDVSTERAYPSLTIVQPTDEWVDVSSAIFTPHDRVILKRYGWHVFSLFK
jgi:hypothetical protein